MCFFLWLAEEEPAPGGFLSYTAAAPPPPQPVVTSQHQPPTQPPSRPAYNQHVSNGGPASHVPLDQPDDYKEYQKRVWVAGYIKLWQWNWWQSVIILSCFRAGTREVHNKLEKNRRAHLKECFELLKRQLPVSQDEKKSSNLSILHSALRYIQVILDLSHSCPWGYVPVKARGAALGGVAMHPAWHVHFIYVTVYKGGTVFSSSNDDKADCWSYRRGERQNCTPKWFSHSVEMISN